MVKKHKLWTVIIILIITSLYLVPRLSGQDINSLACKEPKKIDGLVDDWDLNAFHSIKKVRVDYAVANDSRHLYLALVVKEPGRIMREPGLQGLITGITVYLSPAGKENKDIGYFFVQRRVSPEEAIAELEASGQIIPEEQKEKMRLAKFIQLYDGKPIGKVMKKRMEEAKGERMEKAIFRMNSNKEDLFIEIRMPFRPAESMEPLLNLGQSFNLGLEWGGKAVDLELMQYLQMELIKIWSWAPEAGLLPEMGTNLTDMPTRIRFRKFNFWNGVKLAEISE
ncbi:MAG: hypothetical protein H5U05_06595 [Candidatus Aminicenantes bacterium]|nr:hypothetical protein [Candidatus Aminicenantes bacterium]